MGEPSDPEDVRVDEGKVGRTLEATMRARSEWWIVGTSLAFEGVVLGLAAWIFCRRDF
jgi:hypothetical protein